jgi:hypothetical protein
MLAQIPATLAAAENDENAPVSGQRARGGDTPPRLSELLWGIRWGNILPIECTEGVTVHAASYDEAMRFVRAHYEEIFPSVPGSPFGRVEINPAKERYYRHAADFFEFRKSGEAVAILICDPTDWGTYYIRSAGAKRDCQGHGAIQRFFPFLFETLARAGVERVEAEAAPTNPTSIQHLTRLGFRITGTLMTERWGALVRLVKFLSPERENVFVSQFCAVRPPSGRSAER